MKVLNNVLFFAVGFVLCFILLKKCNGPVEVKPFKELPPSTRHETFKSDTTKPKPEKVEVPVYIKGPARTYTVTVVDSTACNLVRVYQDSLKDANQVIYYMDSVQGRLLGKRIHYKLFVPLKIENTHTIIDSIPYPIYLEQNKLYLSGEVGGNLKQFDFSIGADLITKGRIELGYRYGITQKTHNIKAGYLLFKK